MTLGNMRELGVRGCARQSKGFFMIIFDMLFVGSGLVLNVAAAVPTYNVKPTCRGNG
jgi:hypothetical protein